MKTFFPHICLENVQIKKLIIIVPYKFDTLVVSILFFNTLLKKE